MRLPSRGSSSYDSDGSIASYSWAFGDGETSTVANPSHTYVTAKTYSARLTVTDNNGATASNSISITVRAPAPNRRPVARASATPKTGAAPLEVAFSSSGSRDPDGTINSYAWSFGDGATSTEPNPSHTYAVAGTYTATLTVTDNNGATTAARSLKITAYMASVKDITLTALRGKTGPYAKATVTIVTQSGRPAVSAVVNGMWSNETSPRSKKTGASGRVSFTSPVLVGGGTLTFSVIDVMKFSYQYDSSQNVETSDSITLAP